MRRAAIRAAATLFVSGVRAEAPFAEVSESGAVGVAGPAFAAAALLGVAFSTGTGALAALAFETRGGVSATGATAADALTRLLRLSSIGPEALRAADTVVLAAALVMGLAGALAVRVFFTGACVAAALAGVFVTFSPAFGLACTAALFNNSPAGRFLTVGLVADLAFGFDRLALADLAAVDFETEDFEAEDFRTEAFGAEGFETEAFETTVLDTGVLGPDVFEVLDTELLDAEAFGAVSLETDFLAAADFGEAEVVVLLLVGLDFALGT